MLPLPMTTLLPAGPESITTAAAALARGELVAFPTETVYGLGADATNETAIAQVYRLKGRPSSHPLIVHLPAMDALWRWADRAAQAAKGYDPAAVEALATELWPGPVTFVLRANPDVSPLVTGSQDTVAVRLPGNDTALALLAAFGRAMVAPSANRFGYVSPTTAQHVADEFPGDLLVLDAGPTELGLESTIVDLSTPRPRLLRPGAMPLARIEAALGVGLARETRPPVGDQAPAGAERSVPRVPGSLEKHYAPNAPVRLATRERLMSAPAGSGVIARFRAPASAGGGGAAGAAGARQDAGAQEPAWLELPAAARGFGRGLYAALRELDARGVEEILVERPPEGDEWLAVRDRLDRAAAGSSAPVTELAHERRVAAAGREEPAPNAGPAVTGADGRLASAAAGNFEVASADNLDTAAAGSLVAVVMGSVSDWETMRHADELLTRFGVPHSCQVVSAHRTPAKMAAFAAGAAAAGYRVIIAGAGGAAHLPGMIAAQTHLPVLGVPVMSSALNGLDSLLSQVQMPRGVPVGTLAIGPAGALNAALLAVAILALNDEALENELITYRSQQTQAALAATLPSPNFRQ